MIDGSFCPQACLNVRQLQKEAVSRQGGDRSAATVLALREKLKAMKARA